MLYSQVDKKGIEYFENLYYIKPFTEDFLFADIYRFEVTRIFYF